MNAEYYSMLPIAVVFNIYIHTHKNTHTSTQCVAMADNLHIKLRSCQEYTGSQCTGRREDGVKGEDVSEKGTDALIHILYTLGVQIVLF